MKGKEYKMPLKLRNYIKIVLTVLTLALPMLLPATSFAGCNTIETNVAQGAASTTGGTGSCTSGASSYNIT